MQNLFQRKIFSLDFGTANCIIIEKNKGIVLNEPTVVAISVIDKKVIAVGDNAKKILGKTPVGIEARRPVKNGGISNFRLSQALVKKFFNGVTSRYTLLKPDVIVSAPAGLSSVEERALIQVVSSIGIRKLYILPEPVAAAIGAKIPIHLASGNLIVNLGGGTAEVAILSLNGVVTFESFKGAGDAINEEIVNYFIQKYAILIGEVESEKLKINYLSFTKQDSIIEIQGKNIKTGLPCKIQVSSNELMIPARIVLDKIANITKMVISRVPPELALDIMNNGMVLTGGTSLIDGLDIFLAKAIGIPAFVAENPLTCVARGLDLSLENLDEYRRSIKNY